VTLKAPLPSDFLVPVDPSKSIVTSVFGSNPVPLTVNGLPTIPEVGDTVIAGLTGLLLTVNVTGDEESDF